MREIIDTADVLELIVIADLDSQFPAGLEEGVRLLPGKLRIIDQTRLPQELTFLELDDIDDIAAAIRRLSVRGAPAIGCAAAAAWW